MPVTPAQTGLLPERPESLLTESLRPLLSRTQYAITRYRVTLCIYEAPGESPGPGEEWVALADLPHIAMPGPWPARGGGGAESESLLRGSTTGANLLRQ